MGHHFGRIAVVAPPAAPHAPPDEPNRRPGLTVSRPDDPLEQAADRAAERVMRAADAAVGPAVGGAPARASAEPQEQGVTAESAERITSALQSGGRPLDPSTRAFMEPRFGHDFGRVRVHEDAEAARSVGAKAFTLGNEIVFGHGHYAPETSAGRRLIAHELAHVAQEARPSALVQRSPDSGGTDVSATAAVTGAAPQPEPLGPSGGGGGSTTLEDPPKSQTLDVHGTNLAEVAAALPTEPGAVDFDFTVATDGDPITRAVLNVHQTLTLPKWIERDSQCAPVQREWEKFAGALKQHEEGHLAIDREVFANAHRRYAGKPVGQTETISAQLRKDVQAKQDAYDLRTDHGRKGTPPTVIDTSVTCPEKQAEVQPDGTKAATQAVEFGESRLAPAIEQEITDRTTPAPEPPPGSAPAPMPAPAPGSQRLAGGPAVSAPPQGQPATQGQPPPAGAAKTGAVAYHGRMFTTDPAQLRRLLETMVAELGQSEAETVAYRFLRMGPEEKIPLQFQGYDPELIAQVQAAFEPVLKQLQDERKSFVEQFEKDAADATRLVLTKSHDELKKEEAKYTLTFPGHAMPDADALRAAAKALAAKRKEADVAAAAAEKANRDIVDQNKQQAPFPIGGTAPQVPFFPNAALREKGGKAADAWWKLEHEYSALRNEKEKTFPALAMYAYNEDGQAADRLDDLPTWGPFADTRLMNKVSTEARDRLMNNEKAQEDLKDPARVWSLSKMLDLTLKQRQAKPFQEKWVREQAAKAAQAAAEREKLIAAVAIGVAIVTVALTAGAALAVEGTAGAAVLASMAAGAQAVSTGLTIAVAFEHLEKFRTELAESGDTALDRANALAGADPSFFWLALDLAAAALELGALKAAFSSMRASIQSARTARNVSKLAAELSEIGQVNKVPQATVDAIGQKVAAELEAASTTPNLGAAQSALDRLKEFDKIPAAERAQVLLDALGGGDVGAVLTNSGKSAPELLEIVGRQSIAGQRLQGALARVAYDKVGPKLRALGLDDSAVARVCSMADIDKIKGQLLEEVLEIEVKRKLALDVGDAARKKLLMGAEAEGTPEFIAGRRITDVHQDALTDGILGVLRDGSSGEKEVLLIRAFEGKAGKAARSQLSMKALRSKNTRLLVLSADDQDQLIKVATEMLRKRNPDLARLSSEAIADAHPQELLDIIEKEIPQNEWGQAFKTSQRLGLDVHPVTGEDMPAEILIDGVRRKVVFPGGAGRPQITGVLPSDLSAGKLADVVGKKQGVKLDMMNLETVSQKQLTDLAREVGGAKGLGPATPAP